MSKTTTIAALSAVAAALAMGQGDIHVITEPDLLAYGYATTNEVAAGVSALKEDVDSRGYAPTNAVRSIVEGYGYVTESVTNGLASTEALQAGLDGRVSKSGDAIEGNLEVRGMLEVENGNLIVPNGRFVVSDDGGATGLTLYQQGIRPPGYNVPLLFPDYVAGDYFASRDWATNSIASAIYDLITTAGGAVTSGADPHGEYIHIPAGGDYYVSDFKNHVVDTGNPHSVTGQQVGVLDSNGNVAEGLVVTSSLADGAVTTAKIGLKQVTGARIADNTLENRNFSDNSISGGRLQANSVTGAPNDQDTDEQAGKLAYNTVGTVNLRDGAVTSNKLAQAVRDDIDGKADAQHTHDSIVSGGTSLVVMDGGIASVVTSGLGAPYLVGDFEASWYDRELTDRLSMSFHGVKRLHGPISLNNYTYYVPLGFETVSLGSMPYYISCDSYGGTLLHMGTPSFEYEGQTMMNYISIRLSDFDTPSPSFEGDWEPDNGYDMKMSGSIHVRRDPASISPLASLDLLSEKQDALPAVRDLSWSIPVNSVSSSTTTNFDLGLVYGGILASDDGVHIGTMGRVRDNTLLYRTADSKVYSVHDGAWWLVGQYPGFVHTTENGFSSTTPNCAVVIGNDAGAAACAVSIGQEASAYENRGVVVGEQAAGMEDGVALGWRARSYSKQGVAIGRQAHAGEPNGTLPSSSIPTPAAYSQAVAIGYNARARAQGAVQIGEGINTEANTLRFRGDRVAMMTDVTNIVQDACNQVRDEVLGVLISLATDGLNIGGTTYYLTTVAPTNLTPSSLLLYDVYGGRADISSSSVKMTGRDGSILEMSADGMASPDGARGGFWYRDSVSEQAGYYTFPAGGYGKIAIESTRGALGEGYIDGTNVVAIGMVLSQPSGSDEESEEQPDQQDSGESEDESEEQPDQQDSGAAEDTSEEQPDQQASDEDESEDTSEEVPEEQPDQQDSDEESEATSEDESEDTSEEEPVYEAAAKPLTLNREQESNE